MRYKAPNRFVLLLASVYSPNVGRNGNPHWEPSKDGPWDFMDEALAFAEAEAGVPWVIVDRTNRPRAFGDCFGQWKGEGT